MNPYWLIERHEHVAFYWEGTVTDDYWNWNIDPQKAVRFPTKEAAEFVRTLLKLDYLYFGGIQISRFPVMVCDHVDCGGPSLQEPRKDIKEVLGKWLDHGRYTVCGMRLANGQRAPCHCGLDAAIESLYDKEPAPQQHADSLAAVAQHKGETPETDALAPHLNLSHYDTRIKAYELRAKCKELERQRNELSAQIAGMK